jgi:hypothetical protein
MAESADNEGSDGSLRAAVFSFLLRVREVGRYESLDRDCMGTHGLVVKAGGEGGMEYKSTRRPTRGVGRIWVGMS